MSIAGAKSSGTAVTQVDVFTDEPYTGNPAGVCVLDHSRDDIWMSRCFRRVFDHRRMPSALDHGDPASRHDPGLET